MEIHNVALSDDTYTIAADSAQQDYDSNYATIGGYATAHGPFVSLALRVRDLITGKFTYSDTHLTPDEARSLAARLLDAADAADAANYERSN